MAKYNTEYEDTIEGGAGAVDEYFSSTANLLKRWLLKEDEVEFDEDDYDSEEFDRDNFNAGFEEIYEDYDDFYDG